MNGIARWVRPRRLSDIKRHSWVCDIFWATRLPTLRCTWESWLEVRTRLSAQPSKFEIKKKKNLLSFVVLLLSVHRNGSPKWIHVRNIAENPLIQFLKQLWLTPLSPRFVNTFRTINIRFGWRTTIDGFSRAEWLRHGVWWRWVHKLTWTTWTWPPQSSEKKLPTKLKLCKLMEFFFHVSRTRSLIYGQNNTQTWGLIVLLVSKAAGHAPNVPEMEQDKSAGVLISQRTLAEVVEMVRTANLVHSGVFNLQHLQNAGNNLSSDSDMIFGNKIALLGGDYLLGSASAQIGRLKWVWIQPVFSCFA